MSVLSKKIQFSRTVVIFVRNKSYYEMKLLNFSSYDFLDTGLKVCFALCFIRLILFLALLLLLLLFILHESLHSIPILCLCFVYVIESTWCMQFLYLRFKIHFWYDGSIKNKVYCYYYYHHKKIYHKKNALFMRKLLLLTKTTTLSA